LQLADDASQIGNQLVETIGVIELSTDFDLSGTGGSHVVHNATVLSTEHARVDQ
jgi:hypothetical protein